MSETIARLGSTPLFEAAYALLVAGAALVWAPLAVVVAGLYFLGLAIVWDRRAQAEEPK